jgi:hypothetical protein
MIGITSRIWEKTRLLSSNKQTPVFRMVEVIDAPASTTESLIHD